MQAVEQLGNMLTLVFWVAAFFGIIFAIYVAVWTIVFLYKLIKVYTKPKPVPVKASELIPDPTLSELDLEPAVHRIYVS